MSGAHEATFRTLDAEGTDRVLCQSIAEESRVYFRRRPLSITATISTTTNINDRQAHWLGYIQDQCTLHEDKDLDRAYGDFRRRYNLAFRTNTDGDSRKWISLISPAQSKLVLQVLGEVRDDLRQAGTVEQKLVILLARTPYALYERMNTSWTTYCMQLPPHEQVALPFPEVLRVMYPERAELSRIINNTPRATWPTVRANTHAVRPPIWHALLAHVRTTQYIAANGSSPNPYSPGVAIYERDRPFLQNQMQSCLADFTSNAAMVWYENAHDFEKLELVQALELIRSHAHTLHIQRGPFWTVRYLQHYTFHAFHEQLVNTFAGFSITPAYPISHAAQYALGSAAGTGGNLRRNIIYGRQRSRW